MHDPHDDLEVELVDLTGLSLSDLRMIGDEPLAHSLRRMIKEIQDGTADVVSGFDSSIDSAAGEDV